MNTTSAVTDSASTLIVVDRLTSFHAPSPPSSSVPEVLMQLEVVKSGWESSQALKLWTAQICGGLAIGLFPYTPGLIQSCKPSHNAGWLCGARIATFVAASGAVVIGLLAGASFFAHRNWLADHACELAVTLGTDPGTPKIIVERALRDYLELGDAERQRVRVLCRRPSHETF